MSQDPTLERWRAAFASLAGRHVAAHACPPGERLWAAARGEAGTETTGALVLHVAGCPACAEAWRLALALAEVEPAAERVRTRPRWRAWGALAAAAALVLAAGLWLRGPDRVEPPRYRGEAPLVVRSRVSEHLPLPRSACVLRWTPGPAGTRYDVRVATEALTPVAQVRGLERAFFEVPTRALAALPGGAKLVWQVEVLLPDGSRVASPAFVARVE